MRLDFGQTSLSPDQMNGGAETGGGQPAGGGAGDGGGQPAGDTGGSGYETPNNDAAGDDYVDDGDGGEETPAYTPNHKFKVLNEEKEFDDFVKEAIRDEESEKKIRELYEKSHGLDHVKAARERAEEKLQTQTQELEYYRGNVGKLQHFLGQGDLESFFEGCQIPEEQILRYALKRIELRENPALMAASEEARRARLQNFDSQGQLTRYQQQERQTAIQNRGNELDIALARPEVSQMANAFDTRLGRAGAFKQEVINRGVFYHKAHGVDKSVEEIVKEVVSLFGGTPASALPGNGQNAPGQAQPRATSGSAAQAKKPTIPHVSGTGASPARHVPKSIKELREIGQRKAKANGYAP